MPCIIATIDCKSVRFRISEEVIMEGLERDCPRGKMTEMTNILRLPRKVDGQEIGGAYYVLMTLLLYVYFQC